MDTNNRQIFSDRKMVKSRKKLEEQGICRIEHNFRDGWYLGEEGESENWLLIINKDEDYFFNSSQGTILKCWTIKEAIDEYNNAKFINQY